jgi:hypothetical protein
MKTKRTVLLFSLIIAMGGCYLRTYKMYKTNQKGIDVILLEDSVEISVSYEEVFINVSSKHSGSSIRIESSDNSKLPIEIDISTLKKIKTTFFDLELGNTLLSKNSTTKGDKIIFNSSPFYAHLVYHSVGFKKKNVDNYSENQKVQVPSFDVKQGENKYTKNRFEAIYPR